MKSLEAEETHQNKESSRTNREKIEEKESNVAAASATEPVSETDSASGPTLMNHHDVSSSSEADDATNDESIDVSARTKATVTVVGRSSTSGNGLLRRWDLNFFKSR